mmetsp:Transcript_21534/g.31285  ORF Transcript_21534/g.31285 Transcript_21534/m.31285 type:complete len:220 (-) Transcript_21534:179-838(-)
MDPYRAMLSLGALVSSSSIDDSPADIIGLELLLLAGIDDLRFLLAISGEAEDLEGNVSIADRLLRSFAFSWLLRAAWVPTSKSASDKSKESLEFSRLDFILLVGFCSECAGESAIGVRSGFGDSATPSIISFQEDFHELYASSSPTLSSVVVSIGGLAALACCNISLTRSSVDIRRVLLLSLLVGFSGEMSSSPNSKSYTSFPLFFEPLFLSLRVGSKP